MADPEGDFVVRDFRFAGGETLPQLRLHYTTLGEPRRDAKGRVTNAVMVLHGTGGAGGRFLSPQFAEVLYRPGGLLDIRRWYVILPDGIGHGKSSKPSDGLHTHFPHYGYTDRRGRRSPRARAGAVDSSSARAWPILIYAWFVSPIVRPTDRGPISPETAKSL